jgi:hypothetical protein
LVLTGDRSDNLTKAPEGIDPSNRRQFGIFIEIFNIHKRNHIDYFKNNIVGLLIIIPLSEKSVNRQKCFFAQTIGDDRYNIIEGKSKRHFKWLSLTTLCHFSLPFNQALCKVGLRFAHGNVDVENSERWE